MAVQAYTPYQWNSTAIDGSGNIKCSFLEAGNSPVSDPRTIANVEAEIPGVGPKYVRNQPKGGNWIMYAKLTTANEPDVQTLYAVFSEELGSVTLRVKDSTGKIWRIACSAASGPVRQQGAKNFFRIPIRAPKPLFEEDSAAAVGAGTGSELAKQANFNFTLTNAGSRASRPLFTITANAAKSINSAIGDYTAVLEGFLVNRSPKEINNKPVYLFDQSGAQARIGTDTSAAGTTVQKTTGNTTLNGALTATATTIPVTSAAGFNTNGGLAVITWVTGATFGTMECISYTGVSGNNLTGVTRGLGGTTAQAHNNLDRIDLCGTMPNGDDCRVWLDDVPDYTRYIVNWNVAGSSSDVVINVNLPAASTYTLVAAMTASVPANGSSFTVNEDISRLAQKGFLVIDNEVIYYNSRSGRTFSGIQRAQWRTTAATHVIASNVWANPKHYVVACGYAGATPPPAPLSQRPCIQLPGSSNQTWKWGDESNDAKTIYYDVNYPDRTAQLVPGFDLDGNTVSPLMSLNAAKASGSGGTVAAEFIDNVPGDGNPPINFLEAAIPMGIHTGASAITNDWTPAAEILNLELWTRDVGGTLKLQDQLQQSAAAAGRVNATLPAIAYAMKLKARYNAITGGKATDAYSTAYQCANVAYTTGTSFATNSCGIRVVINQDTVVKKIAIRMRLSGAGSVGVNLCIAPDNGSQLPGSPLVIHQSALTDYVVTSTSGEWATWSIPKGALLKAGTYWLILQRGNAYTGAGQNVQVAFATQASQTCRLDQLTTGPSTWSGTYGLTVPWFYIYGDYDNSGNAAIQSDQPVLTAAGARSATTASFDKTILTLSTSQSIYVHRIGAFGTTLMHLNGLLTNTTTGDSMLFDLWMPLTATLAVDCDARTVIHTAAAVAYPCGKAVTFSNTADPCAMSAAANVFTYVDAGLLAPASLDLVATYRGVKE